MVSADSCLPMSSWIPALEPSGNLLGRAAFGQMGPDMLPQPGIQEFARSPRLTGPSLCQGVRRAGSIGVASRGVAGRLAAQSTGRPSQYCGNRLQRMAAGQPQTQGFAFFGSHVAIGSRSHGNTVANHGLKCCTWS